jgi:DNA primase
MSGKITDPVIEEIRARIDIAELIGARVTLKKSGGTFKGCCPFHREKTPSFHVNPVRQRYHCFGCGEDGDIFTFLMKQDGLTFHDAVRTLAERVGVVIRQDVDYSAKNRDLLYAIHAELAAFYQRCLKQTREAAPARHYLERRKLPGEIVERFGIGYAPTAPHDALTQWAKKYGYTPDQLVAAGILSPPNKPDRPDDFYDRFRGRLMFPICDRRGRVVAFSARILDANAHPAKYVNSPETDIFTKSRVLYALDKAAAKIVKHPHREAIVCEGQIDVIRCHACGFETAVASQGTSFTKEHVSLLKKHADSVVLVFDGDGAGRKAALRTGALFLEEEMPVRVAVLPPGEDPDSLLRDKGPASFRELLENAASITAFQVDTLLHAEERPDSIDAVNRIARDVLDMLAACPSAVLRTRLLQEASARLHLPYSAMEVDLEKHTEALRQRTSRESREPRAETGSPRSEAGNPPPGLTPPAADSEISPFDSPAPEPPSRTEILLCEFLVEHEHDGDVLDQVERHLPLALIPHSFAQSVVSALLAQRRSGGDQLAELCRTTAPEWQPLLGSLLANQQKMLSAREMTKDEAARDLIRALWIMRVKQARGQLPSESISENDRLRFSLTTLIKTLETQPWEKISRLMTAGAADALKPGGDPGALWPLPGAAAVAAAAASSARAADTASATDGPEEFPPSEYPLDEMLD